MWWGGACGFKEDQKSPSSWKNRQRVKPVCRNWFRVMKDGLANVMFKGTLCVG